MKILVLGASQGTGARVVKASLARGHAVTAFSRRPEKLDVQHEQLTRLAGDFQARASVEAAVKGHDAVIITASASSLKAFKDNPTFFSQGTGYAIEAMKANGVRRLVILSAAGTGESKRLLGFVVKKLLIPFILKRPFEDHERQEALVRSSGLDWVIALPTRLTNGPARGEFVKTAELKPVPSSISRADLADFLLEAAASNAWVQKSVLLGG